jgi:hypothetical protein
MTKLELTKTLVNVVVGAGTTKIVSGIIKNNTNPETITDTVTIASGSIVLGSMAADASKQYTSDKLDQIADWWNKNVKK